MDRGSKSYEVKKELSEICFKIKNETKCLFSKYCFLEVTEPQIDEVLNDCFKLHMDKLIIIPYFLYSGKKVKLAINRIMKFYNKTTTKIIISKPMLMHTLIIKAIEHRISKAMQKNNITINKQNIDVLIICHGSKESNSHFSIMYVIDELRPKYRNVKHCFLEIENPDINNGILYCANKNPDVLVIVLYFLHSGIHVKYDVHKELDPAIKKYKLKKVIITDHIGKDKNFSDLVIKRYREVENAN